MAKTRHDVAFQMINKKLESRPNTDENNGYTKEQQNSLITKQFQKQIRNDYYDKVAIESDRRQAYLDFEQMEYYPTIAAALDVMAEEATLSNKKGQVMNIYSNKTRVKEELEYLFYSVLNINTNLYWWVRNILKNGDMFLLLLGLDGEGIVNASILNKLVERKEVIDEETKRLRVQFVDNQRNAVYERQQIAHFRLTGSENRIPYGQSVLEKIRKIHKMLVLAEDSMMIKRITRSTDRYIYNVNVGNVAPNDSEAYINAIANKFKDQPIVNNINGNVDYKYDVKDVTQDYFIPNRGNNPATNIDVLSASSTLDQISDIEYLRNELHTGLGTPMPFINYNESTGDGKSLSSLDHRFARKTIRHQQCVIQELNFIGKIHLILRGFEEDCENFTLTLNPSSIQKEILEVDHLSNKLSAYQNAVTPNDATQIAPMSELKAKMELLGWSKDEIALDLKQQFFERGLGEEFRKNFDKIDTSSVFEELIKKFKKVEDDGEEKNDDENKESENNDGDDTTNENPFESENKATINKLRKKSYGMINEIEKDKSQIKFKSQ